MREQSPNWRVRRSGKFFRAGKAKWFAKGFCYGPFAPREDGAYLPPPIQLAQDLEHIASLGANVLRVYQVPPREFLDEALKHGLRVFVDIPWEKHRCFLEDWQTQEDARQLIRKTARALSGHPGLFAISVANEIPVDVVRYLGRARVEAFLSELMQIAKQEAPEALVTFVNYPTTEFLFSNECDFLCFNVFIHNKQKLANYLDRLQHLAGEKPVILGEYGIDTLREGEQRQAELLSQQIQIAYKHGFSGSFVFSYTDEWFTGGHSIEDWNFGVCRQDRSEKPSANAIRKIWKAETFQLRKDWPRVSVVVCSYNGGATLQSCLESLMNLEYPDFEVFLIDDGSTDDTPKIAEDYPQVVYHRQENRGLGVARNVGAELSSGDIVAYTDSDCVVDEHWLYYLVDAMESQEAEAIGGLNLSPENDGWVAKCVNASPGNPAHVMLDDQRAEHVPGCNMAFRRHVLIGLGGFDPQFRQAGDDVDICWRMLDANLNIGFAPAAVVWHHRRATVEAFARQQRGYGRSEALVHFKHPQRCGTFGRSIWRGVIYGDAMMGELSSRDVVYHGRFGVAPFQIIYRSNHFSYLNTALSLEWHGVAVFLLLLSSIFPGLAMLSLVMWGMTFAVALRAAAFAQRPEKKRFLSWLLVGYLHIMQPIVRGWYRLTHLLRGKKLPRAEHIDGKQLFAGWKRKKKQTDIYWESKEGLGREVLLPSIVHRARTLAWPGDCDNAWTDWDIKLVGDPWHDVEVRTATEELGGLHRFSRVSISLTGTHFATVVASAVSIWSLAGILGNSSWAIIAGLLACVALLLTMRASRRSCLDAATQLVANAILAVEAGKNSGSEANDLAGKETGMESHFESSHPVSEVARL